jgi:hypothetical protein
MWSSAKPKFSYLLFGNPTNKIETRIANQWKTINNKPFGPIIFIDQLKIRSNS